MGIFNIFKYANPANFLNFCKKIFPFVVTLTIIFLGYGLFSGFFNSPKDYQQGNLVRIMYVHVPSAWMALMIYSSIAIASCVFLINKHLLANIYCKACSPIGACFTLIAIITGSIWGKPTWGVWWVWDARLTSMAILLIFYLAYIFTWKYVKNFERANKISSVIGIIGLFNLPVIKYSVDWWNTLHQPSSITLTSAPTIHYTMLVPLIIMFLGMVVYSLIIFLMRYKTELMKFKLDKKNQK